jgi:hypothetical protein
VILSIDPARRGLLGFGAMQLNALLVGLVLVVVR